MSCCFSCFGPSTQRESNPVSQKELDVAPGYELMAEPPAQETFYIAPLTGGRVKVDHTCEGSNFSYNFQSQPPIETLPVGNKTNSITLVHHCKNSGQIRYFPDIDHLRLKEE